MMVVQTFGPRIPRMNGPDAAVACLVAVLLSQGVTGWSLLFPATVAGLAFLALAALLARHSLALEVPGEATPYVLLALVLFSSLYFDWRVVVGSDVPSPVRKDALRALVLCAVVGLALGLPARAERTEALLQRVLLPIAAVGTFLALLGFVKLMFLAYGHSFITPILPDRPYPGGTSVAHDYNFYALSVACGVIACVALWRTPHWRNAGTIGAGLAVAAGLLSGSRRFVLAMIVLMLFVLLLPWLVNMSRKAASARLVVVAGMAGTLFLIAQAFFLSALEGRLTSQPALRSGQADTLYTVGRLMTLSDTVRAGLAKSLQEAVEEGSGHPFRHDDPVISRRMPDAPPVGSARLDRWRYGLELYRESGRAWIGDGFDYGAAFAGRFGVATGYDYPHNFVISALLYGGLIAAVALIVLLIVSTALYARILLDTAGAVWPLALMYGVVGFYSLTSGDNFFSMPVFGVFVVLPLFLLSSFERTARS